MAPSCRIATPPRRPTGLPSSTWTTPSAPAWPRPTTAPPRGAAGVRTWPNGHGAPCARTTRPTATAWEYLPHDHARSRAYRWNEDGIAGWCDDHQHVCLAMAFWNGVDPILKERFFGVTGNEGNHGEDVKEYWWYLDGTPTPRVPAACATTTRSAEFPYADSSAESRRPRPRRRSSTSWPTPASSTTAGGGASRSPTPRARSTRCASRSPSRTMGPTRRRCTCCRRCGSATRGRGR